MAREHIIEHSSQLNSLTAFRLFRSRRVGTLRLGVVADHPKRAVWESELNRSFHACGCDIGAQGLRLGAIAGVVVAIVAYVGPWGWGAALAAFLALAFAGAAIGKITGLVRAHERLARTVREIADAADAALERRALSPSASVARASTG